ncbi:SDR family NAD(P)-dependent oxidoreductase [Tessaracoccus sp. SD287]|uniref:SDR family NAD(P)-dependent oxidoreductase n=1 Tax=Tessaracoccus sp. SD287 TaxID=2782008 RepID=UPI001A969155|nr:SDR family NAD(P)-dependent oxidoreductase [Tessaracoccus sp. SD287]MBO1030703.1 SDR family NAD(P)-dependent oxidoreductase [Tessaracoccus sp. SD287]
MSHTPPPTTPPTRTALVTGASSGIGAATARWLADNGYQVLLAARRVDRLAEVAAETGGQVVRCDITDPAEVAALAQAVGDSLDLLVNNAGMALGQDPLSSADLDQWEQMYRTNVLGTARVTQALLPALEAARGCIVFVTSTAADAPYEGGGGYNAAKTGERAMVGALRLEIVERPIRVCEISPGMVATEEFSLTRFGGDRDRAASVYQGVDEPLLADDIAECIGWIATRPAHVNIDRMVVRPRAQAANHKVHRRTT